MKHFLFFCLAIATTLLAAPSAHAAVNTNNFYFTDATFDYYLSETETDTSTMRIEESFTAKFPSFDQNHGIERCIPRTYRGVESLDESSFSVTRNGISEPFSTYSNGALVCFRIGSADTYVHDVQTYDISYTMNNVILQPNNSPYQELYWDTNGVEWSQVFENLTATVHLSDSLANAFNGEISCYVGTQGASGSSATSRCSAYVSPNKSEITFTAKQEIASSGTVTALLPGENLTINLQFLPNTFQIAKAKPNFLAYIAGIAFLSIIAVFVFILFRQFNSVKEKRNLANDKARPVQYVPPEGLTVSEASQIYLKSAQDSQVAALMELAIHHNIELEKGEKKMFGGYHWKIIAKNVEHIKSEEKIVLQLLNRGKEVHDGDIIEIKNQGYSYTLEKLNKSYDNDILSSLKSKKLVEDSTKELKHSSSIFGILSVICVIMLLPIFISISAISSTSTDLQDPITRIIPMILFVLSIVYIFTAIILSNKINAYKVRTLEGIRVSNYLDGLKEYMKLAEADRIKFLQSVKGVDTSPQGIVKLYEKLLPYAVIFNLEKSWVDELNRYYKMDDVSNPNWLLGAAYLSTSDFHSFTSYTSNTISSSTASSSSGSSGGGGGGFSGGGGGGGGGGGW